MVMEIYQMFTIPQMLHAIGTYCTMSHRNEAAPSFDVPHNESDFGNDSFVSEAD
jgi:hypothetical protein